MKRILLTGALLAAMTSAACASPRYVAWRVPPPPVARRVVVGTAPGPGYVWTDGYYDLRGRRWVWIPGRWVRPPRARAVWAPGYWAPHRGGWRFRAGYWR
jgi:hypothetical protein